MRDYLDPGILLSVGSDLIYAKLFVDHASSMPCDDFHVGFFRHIARQILVWNEDHSFLKRNVDIYDVGNSALYLLSDLGGGVTGEIHYVDAGYNKVGMPNPKNIT